MESIKESIKKIAKNNNKLKLASDHTISLLSNNGKIEHLQNLNVKSCIYLDGNNISRNIQFISNFNDIICIISEFNPKYSELKLEGIENYNCSHDKINTNYETYNTKITRSRYENKIISGKTIYSNNLYKIIMFLKEFFKDEYNIVVTCNSGISNLLVEKLLNIPAEEGEGIRHISPKLPLDNIVLHSLVKLNVYIYSISYPPHYKMEEHKYELDDYLLVILLLNNNNKSFIFSNDNYEWINKFENEYREKLYKSRGVIYLYYKEDFNISIHSKDDICLDKKSKVMAVHSNIIVNPVDKCEKQKKKTTKKNNKNNKKNKHLKYGMFSILPVNGNRTNYNGNNENNNNNNPRLNGGKRKTKKRVKKKCKKRKNKRKTNKK